MELSPSLRSFPPSPPPPERECRAVHQLSAALLPTVDLPSLCFCLPACSTTRWQAGTLPLSSPLPVLQRPVYLKLQGGNDTSQKMMSITNYSTSWVLPHGCAGAAAQLAPCSPPPSAPWGRSPSAHGRRWVCISCSSLSPRQARAVPLALAPAASWHGQSCGNLREATGHIQNRIFSYKLMAKLRGSSSSGYRAAVVSSVFKGR